MTRVRIAFLTIALALTALVPASPSLAYNSNWTCPSDGNDYRWQLRFYTDNTGDTQINGKCFTAGRFIWLFDVADRNVANSFSLTKKSGYPYDPVCFLLYSDNDQNGLLLYDFNWTPSSSWSGASTRFVDLPALADNQANSLVLGVSNCN